MRKHLLLLFSLIFSISLYAWDGTMADAYAGGDGTESNPYQIATAEQLALLAYSVNDEHINYAGQYFVLTADIDLFGVQDQDTLQWVPIGIRGSASGDQDDSHHPFFGTFDGNNHTIYNLYFNNPNQSYVGLFGNVGHCRLRNIKLSNVFVKAYSYAGALCGYAAYDTFIDNCHVLDGKIITQNLNCGGLVGIMKTYYRVYYNSYNWNYIDYLSSITNCSNYADVEGHSYNILGKSCYGGIVGGISQYQGASHGYIGNCVNYGSVTGVSGTGGICGSIYSTYAITADSITVEGCRNYGDIIPSEQSSHTTSGNRGGIVGVIENGGSIRHCCNAGNLLYASFQQNENGGSGGIVGSINQSSTRVSYCTNIGSIGYQWSYSGGICGNGGSATFTYCLNAGKVSGYAGCGGITGRGYVQNCLSVYGVMAAEQFGEIVAENGNSASSCFFDKQMCRFGYGSHQVSNSDTWGRLTTDMLNDGLTAEAYSSEHWVFADGMYPRPKGIEDTDIAILAATPVILNADSDTEYDKMFTLNCGFRLGDVDGVTWTTDSPLLIHGNEVSIVDAIPNSDYYNLYARYGDANRMFEFRASSIGSSDTLVVTTDHPYVFDGNTYNQSGTYNAVYSSASGCDSIVVLQLTVFIQPEATFSSDITVCQSENEIKIPFTLTAGAAHQAEVTFNASSQQQGFVNGTYPVQNNMVIIQMPTQVNAGNGQCTIQLQDTLSLLSTVAANVQMDIMLDGFLHQKFGTVLLVDNNPSNGLPGWQDMSFTAFQWYKNGNAIQGANEAFIYERNGLNGEYQVLLTNTDGKQILSCPVEIISDKGSYLLLGNIISQGDMLRLQDDCNGFAYHIFTVQGSMLDNGIVTDNQIAATMPAGLYILILTDPSGLQYVEKFFIK